MIDRYPAQLSSPLKRSSCASTLAPIIIAFSKFHTSTMLFDSPHLLTVKGHWSFAHINSLPISFVFHLSIPLDE